MSAQVDPAALLAEASMLTGLDVQQLQDLLSESPADQLMIVQGWRTLDQIGWTKKVDTVQRVIAIFEILGTIAGVVSGVAGAVKALQSL